MQPFPGSHSDAVKQYLMKSVQPLLMNKTHAFVGLRTHYTHYLGFLTIRIINIQAKSKLEEDVTG